MFGLSTKKVRTPRDKGGVNSTKRIGESMVVAFTLMTPQRAAIFFHRLYVLC
jgi:hypothetical protein